MPAVPLQTVCLRRGLSAVTAIDRNKLRGQATIRTTQVVIPTSNENARSEAQIPLTAASATDPATKSAGNGRSYSEGRWPGTR